MQEYPAQSHCRLLLLFATLLLLAYSNTFNASWQLDDPPNILLNKKQQITELTVKQFWDAMTANPADNTLSTLDRPAARITFGLNWFFGKNNVTGYHVVNFIIHLATGCFLFFVIVALLKTPRLAGLYNYRQSTFIAIFSTLLWALNPVQTQAVTYIVQRMTSLATLFALIALLFYLQGRLHKTESSRLYFFFGAFVSYALAFLSKENACIILLIVPFIEIFFFKPILTKTLIRLYTKRLAVLLVVCFLAVIAISPGIFDVILNSYVRRPFTLWERVLTEQRIIVFYLSQLFFPDPARLSVQHDIVLSTSLFSPITTIPAIFFNASLVLLALKLYKRQPLFSLAVIFYYVNHLVESTIIPLELIFEHRNYLPSLFLFLPLAQFICFLWDHTRRRTVHFIIFISVTATITTLSYATFFRNAAWQSQESLWLDAAAKAPLSSRPLSSLALYYGWGADNSEPTIRRALEIQTQALGSTKNRTGLSASILGNVAEPHAKLGEYDESVDTYNKALKISPGNLELRFNFSKILLRTGQFAEAEKEILTVLMSDPNTHPDCLNLFAILDLYADRPTRAFVSLQHALKMSPTRPDYLMNFGKTLSMLGYYQRAAFFFERSLEHGRENIILALCRIENALREGDLISARIELNRALLNHPLPLLVKPLQESNNKLYRYIPLDNELIKAFITRELGDFNTLFRNFHATDQNNNGLLDASDF